MREAALTISLNAHVSILLLYNAGLTDKQMAERAGVPEAEILDWRHANGYPKNPRRNPEFARAPSPRETNVPKEPEKAEQPSEQEAAPVEKRPRPWSRRKGHQGRYRY